MPSNTGEATCSCRPVTTSTVKRMYHFSIGTPSFQSGGKKILRPSAVAGI